MENKTDGIIQKRMGFWEWYLVEKDGWETIAGICILINIVSFLILALFDPFWANVYIYLGIFIAIFLTAFLIMLFIYVAYKEWFECKKREYEEWVKLLEGETE
jgi:Na+/H+ antiporter NhaC